MGDRGTSVPSRMLLDMTEQVEAEMKEVGEWLQEEVSRARRAGLRLLLAQALFAAALVLMKSALAHVTPEVFALAHALASLPLLILLGLATPRSRAELQWKSLRASEWLPYLCFLGVVGMFASQFLLAQGLKVAGVTNAVVLGQLVPVYTCVIGVFRLQEAPSAFKFFSIFISVLGAIVMLDPVNMSLSAGNLCFLLRALCFAAYLTLQAPILSHLSSVTVACVAQCVGAILLLLVGLPFVARGGGVLAAVPASAWAGAGGVAALVTAAYALTSSAGKSVSPVVMAVYGSTQPIMAWLLGAAYFGERLCLREVYGAVLILIGTFVTVAIEDGEKRAPGGGAQLAAMQCYLGTCGIVYSDDGSCLPARVGTQMTTNPQGVGRWTAIWTLWWATASSLVAMVGGSSLIWAAVWLWWKFVA